MKFLLSVIAVCLLMITAKLYIPEANADIRYELLSSYEFKRAVEKIVEDEILKVTDTEIMMNYVASGVEPRGIKLKENFYEEYKEIVEKEINENGFFKIIKRSPLYICKKKN